VIKMQFFTLFELQFVTDQLPDFCHQIKKYAVTHQKMAMNQIPRRYTNHFKEFYSLCLRVLEFIKETV